VFGETETKAGVKVRPVMVSMPLGRPSAKYKPILLEADIFRLVMVNTVEVAEAVVVVCRMPSM